MAGLPKYQKDPYKDVDESRFDTADKLTTAQRLEMAQLAESRGNVEARGDYQKTMALKSSQVERMLGH